MDRFFPAMHYLSNSKVAIAAISNFAFAMVLCIYHLVRKVSWKLLAISSAPGER